MAPAALRYRSGKGYQIVHRCERCGHVSVNKVAVDTVQPDEIIAVASLSGVGESSFIPIVPDPKDQAVGKRR